MSVADAAANLRVMDKVFRPYSLEYQRLLSGGLRERRRPPDPMFVVGTFLLEHHLMPAAWTNGLMDQFSRSRVLNSYLVGHVRLGGM